MGRFSKIRPKQNTVKLPFNPEVRDFIEESFKYQTLFANCEGFYPVRIVKQDEEMKLTRFIHDTMFFNEFQNKESQEEIDKSTLVRHICDKIRSLSQKYDLDGEIHFSVIWTCYFEYETKTKRTAPVFKILKDKSGNEAVFLDPFLKTYESWDCYLETADYPESFLCVPRHGKYNFDKDTGVLLVEFLRARKLEENKTMSCLKCFFPNAPFSVTVVRPLFKQIRTLAHEVKEKIIHLIHILFDGWDRFKGPIMNVAVFVFLTFIKTKNDQWSMDWKSISSAAFMLLNTCAEENNFSDLFKSSLLNPQTTSIPGAMTISETEKFYMDIYHERGRLMELLGNPKKNFLEILNLCFFLIKKWEPFPLLLLENQIFKSLHLIVKVMVLILSKINLSRPFIENNVLGITKELENKFVLEDAQKTPILFAPENQVQQESKSDTENQNTIDIRHITLEKVIQNLSFLETIPSKKIYNQILLEAMNELKSRDFPLDDKRNVPLEIGREHDYVIYLFPKLSFSCLIAALRQILRRDICLKPETSWIIEVIDLSHKSLGKLLFPHELMTVGAFSLKAIEEVVE